MHSPLHVAPAGRPLPLRLRRFTTVVATLLVSAGLSVAVTSPAQAVTGPASPSTSPVSSSCAIAGVESTTGPSDLCWVDLSGYAARAATSASGQRFSVRTTTGDTLTFTLSVAGGAVQPTKLGAYADSYLGTHGFETGVPGRPALSQSTQTTTTTATLTNLRLVDASGQKVSSFTLVAADAESTNAGESLVFQSDVDLAATKTTPIGDACQGYLTGFGSRTVDCTGGPQIASLRDGTITVAATNPTTLTTKMVGGGEEGVAFAVKLSSIEKRAVAVSGRDESAGHSQSFSPGSQSMPWNTPSIITAGLLLVAAAGVVLVTRRRRDASH